MLFDATLADPKTHDHFPNVDPSAKLLLMHTDDFGIFMSYWYSSIYVVIEGFKELKLQDAKIEALLQSPNVKALQLYRNATFHFQKEYLSPKMNQFMQSKDSVSWIRSLTEAFGEFFLGEVSKLTKNEHKN